MMAQAAKIQETTGKPYFIMGTLAGGDAANATRAYYTLLYTQGGTSSPTATTSRTSTRPESPKAFDFFQTISSARRDHQGPRRRAALAASSMARPP